MKDLNISTGTYYNIQTYFIITKYNLCFMKLYIARVCSKHFEPSNYIEKSPIKKLLGWSPKHYRVLKCDAVPSICLPFSIALIQNSNLVSYVVLDRTVFIY